MLVSVALLSACTSRGEGYGVYDRAGVQDTRYAKFIRPSIPITFGGGEGTIIKKAVHARRSSGYSGHGDSAKAIASKRDNCYLSYSIAMKELQNHAIHAKATKIINTISYLGTTIEPDPSKFICSYGNARVAVFLRGDLAE